VSNKWSDYKRAFSAINLKSPEDNEVKFALEFLQANPIWDVITSQEHIDNSFANAILGRYRAVLTDLSEVRNYLKEQTQVIPYNWSGHPDINQLIRRLAQSKYSKEPFEKVMYHIDSMDGDKLKKYMKRLVKNNIEVGIEILTDCGEV